MTNIKLGSITWELQQPKDTVNNEVIKYISELTSILRRNKRHREKK
jgi:hypothetical protein